MAARYSDNEVAVSGTAHPGNDESDDVVTFAREVARSSFGSSSEIQRARRLGRSAIAAYGPPTDFEAELDTSTPDDDRPELAVDHEIADRLEHAGYSFEAEMRYRRLAATYGFSPDRLAPMLEAKHKTIEALDWYIMAAMHRDSNSLLRLALACSLRGHFGWAQKLLFAAIASLHKSVFDKVCSALDEIQVESRPMAIARHLCNVAWKERDANTTYALGTIVSVAGGRPDLGRLIYSCALAKGHPLAALSLVDLVPSDSTEKAHALDGLEVLQVLEVLEVLEFSSIDTPHSAEDKDRWRAIQRSMNNVANHLDYPGKGALIGTLPDGSKDYLYSSKLQRVVNIAQQVAVLYGYASLPCDYRSLKIIRDTAPTIAWRVRENAVARPEAELLTFIAFAFEQAKAEFARAQPKGRSTPRTHKRRGNINEFDGIIPCSGLVHRFQHSLREDLDDDEKPVLILRLSGLGVAEVAQILGRSTAAVVKYEKEAAQKLFHAQNLRHYDAGDCPRYEPIPGCTSGGTRD